MRRLVLTLLLLLSGSALAAPQDGPTRVVEQGAADVAAACRRDTPATDEQCAQVPLSPAVTEAALASYERSLTHRQLQLQFHLADDVPFARAPWLGTHNSFNTTTRTATLSGLDSNQQLSLTDQLRSDMRSLEVDAHLFLGKPVACHARGEEEGHAGCTTEATLDAPLAEIATWVKAHPGEVVLLYLEDHLETDDGYAQASVMVEKTLGPLLWRPTAKGCSALPLDRTRNDVLAAGKQVVLISTCHAGGTWNSQVWDDAARAKDETGPAAYGPGCDPARQPAAFDSHLLRVFEDATALTTTTDMGRDPITVERARLLQRCAVDITGFDELLPGDDRLAASVWSWAAGEPSAGDCVESRTDGWHTVPCQGPVKAVACAGFVVVKRCASPVTPRYGWEQVQLAKAAGSTPVRLGLHRTASGAFVP